MSFDIIKLIESLKNYPFESFIMVLILCLIIWYIKDSGKAEKEIFNIMEEIKQDQLEQNKNILILLEDINIFLKITHNKSGTLISSSSIIFEQITLLSNDLSKIIDYNHFKDDQKYLESKLDGKIEKYKANLHKNLFNVITDRTLLNEIDEIMNINSVIKNMFNEEIKLNVEDHRKLKIKVENFLEEEKIKLIDRVQKYYEKK